jgi:hypothetical protein
VRMQDTVIPDGLMPNGEPYHEFLLKREDFPMTIIAYIPIPPWMTWPEGEQRPTGTVLWMLTVLAPEKKGERAAIKIPPLRQWLIEEYGSRRGAKPPIEVDIVDPDAFDQMFANPDDTNWGSED